MRTIKFRIWDKKENKMNWTDTALLHQGRNIFFNFMIPWRKNIFSNEWEIMQFTGLLDKNGKEIYEGDIIKHSDYGQISIIEWDERSAGWMATSVSNWNPKTNFNSQNDEVVGNKFENPELY